jgi:type VI secretion system secreted protein Hcp
MKVGGAVSNFRIHQEGERYMAQADFFLKIDGVDGEIELLSFSFGVSNAGGGSAGAGEGGGKSSVQDLRLTKLVDKSSPNLLQACATGKHFAAATITVRKPGESPFEYLLSNGGVSAFDVTADNAGVVQESIVLNYSKVEMHYG